MVTNDESLITYFAYFCLLLGAVIGGAVVNLLFCPLPFSIVLPFFLKVLAISLIFFFGLSVYYVVNRGILWAGFSFIGSMWFLTFITSPVVSGLAFYLGDRLYVQEYT